MKYRDVIEDDTIMLRIMFIIYMVCGNFIILNLFISVINEGLTYMKENPEEAMFDQALSDYIQVGLISFFVITFILQITRK